MRHNSSWPDVGSDDTRHLIKLGYVVYIASCMAVFINPQSTHLCCMLDRNDELTAKSDKVVDSFSFPFFWLIRRYFNHQYNESLEFGDSLDISILKSIRMYM